MIAAGFARDNDIPCLGLCLGMQAMTIEYARHVLGLVGANSSEFDRQTPHPVIDLMESQKDVTDFGGTMRLGAYIAELTPDSIVARAYGKAVVSERHRHRYEFNPRYRGKFEGSGFRCTGHSPDNRLVDSRAKATVWVGTSHPGSKPADRRPLFRKFIAPRWNGEERPAPVPARLADRGPGVAGRPGLAGRGVLR